MFDKILDTADEYSDNIPIVGDAIGILNDAVDFFSDLFGGGENPDSKAWRNITRGALRGKSAQEALAFLKHFEWKFKEIGMTVQDIIDSGWINQETINLLKANSPDSAPQITTDSDSSNTLILGILGSIAAAFIVKKFL